MKKEINEKNIKENNTQPMTPVELFDRFMREAVSTNMGDVDKIHWMLYARDVINKTLNTTVDELKSKTSGAEAAKVYNEARMKLSKSRE